MSLHRIFGKQCFFAILLPNQNHCALAVHRTTNGVGPNLVHIGAGCLQYAFIRAIPAAGGAFAVKNPFAPAVIHRELDGFYPSPILNAKAVVVAVAIGRKGRGKVVAVGVAGG